MIKLIEKGVYYKEGRLIRAKGSDGVAKKGTICFNKNSSEDAEYNANLEELNPLKTRLGECLRGWFTHNNINSKDVSYVLFTGGSSKIQCLRDYLIDSVFSKNTTKILDMGESSDIAVAKGACLVGLGKFPYVKDSREQRKFLEKNRIEKGNYLDIIMNAIHECDDGVKKQILDKINTKNLKKEINNYNK